MILFRQSKYLLPKWSLHSKHFFTTMYIYSKFNYPCQNRPPTRKFFIKILQNFFHTCNENEIIPSISVRSDTRGILELDFCTALLSLTQKTQYFLFKSLFIKPSIRTSF